MSIVANLLRVGVRGSEARGLSGCAPVIYTNES